MRLNKTSFMLNIKVHHTIDILSKYWKTINAR